MDKVRGNSKLLQHLLSEKMEDEHKDDHNHVPASRTLRTAACFSDNHWEIISELNHEVFTCYNPTAAWHALLIVCNHSSVIRSSCSPTNKSSLPNPPI